MSPATATVVCLTGVAVLFWLDQNPSDKNSKALWIPVIWIAIACSRPVSQWLHPDVVANSVQDVMQGNPMDRAIYGVFITVGLVVLARRRVVWRILRENQALVLFLAYCIISILWSEYPLIAIKRWVKTVGDLVMILIVLSDPQPIAAFRKVFARLSFVLIPLSILLFKYFRGIGIVQNPWTGSSIVTGVTTNKNTMGAVCLVLGLGAVWRLIESVQANRDPRRFRHIIAHGVILMMIMYLFIKVDSMTSFSSFVMGSTLMIMGSLHMVKRNRFLVHIALAAMVILSASVLFLHIDPHALKDIGRNPTLTDRTFIWEQMLSLVSSPVLGTGFGSFWAGHRLATMWQWDPILRPNEAHDGYLGIYLQLGWVGIGFLAIFLVAVYRGVFRSWRRGDPRGGILLAFLLCGFTYNFTEQAFFQMQSPVWLFFLLTVTQLPRSLTKTQSVSKRTTSEVMELVA